MPYELDRYLQESLEKLPDDKNMLQWWYDRRTLYPKLSRMARNYLSIPGTCFGVPYDGLPLSLTVYFSLVRGC